MKKENRTIHKSAKKKAKYLQNLTTQGKKKFFMYSGKYSRCIFLCVYKQKGILNIIATLIDR